jgi:hypothetical protein
MRYKPVKRFDALFHYSFSSLCIMRQLIYLLQLHRIVFLNLVAILFLLTSYDTLQSTSYSILNNFLYSLGTSEKNSFKKSKLFYCEFKLAIKMQGTVVPFANSFNPGVCIGNSKSPLASAILNIRLLCCFPVDSAINPSSGEIETCTR